MPSLSSSATAEDAPWLAMYTPSSGKAAAKPRPISSRKPVNTACSIGPPGGAAATSTGAGAQGPVSPMRA